MANVTFGFPNWCAGSTVATPTVAAYGGWTAGLPAANVLTPKLAEIARSTDATTANTKLRIDLGAPRDIWMVAIPKSNVSVAGLIRVRLFSDSGYSTEVATTGWLDYWADVYAWGARPWGSSGLFSSKFSAEEAAGYPAVWYYVFSALKIARYLEIEFDDTANADGYIDVSRVVAAPAWQAVINPIYGQTSIRWESASTVRRSRTGVKIVDRRPARRVAVCAFDSVSYTEGFTYPFEMSRRLDLDGEVFFITDPDDTVQTLRRAFLANLRVLPDLAYSTFEEFSTVIEIEEVL